MLHLSVQSLPILKVIADLARELKTKVKKDSKFYSVVIPKDFGSGTISGTDFGGGFGLLNYDCTFLENTTIKFMFDQVHPMKFIHCTEGKFTHLFAFDKINNVVDAFENIIVASSNKNGHSLKFPAKERIQICSIEIDRESFYNKIEGLKEDNPGKLMDVILDKGGNSKFYHKGEYSLVIHNLIRDLLRSKSSTIVDIFFKEGKCYEMLAMQWDQFHEDISKFDFNRKINVKDFHLLNNLTEYIDKNISQPIVVKLLEREFGTNEKKIQMLFKMSHKSTLNVYLQNQRLEKALQLLKNPEYNISDVVYAVGLKNKSYFSKIFKKKFGLTPTEFVQKK